MTGARAAPSRALDRLPLYFVQNRGQTDPRVAFYLPGQGNTIYFASDGLTFAFTSAADQGPATSGFGPRARGPALAAVGRANSAAHPAQRWAVKLDFVGANPNVQPVGESKSGAAFSYFKGPPSQWQAGVPGFAQLRYPGLWPGIDLVYSGQAGQLKYEFVVQPGADPARIRMAYRGASAVRLTADGQLEVTTPLTSFHDAAPQAYQMKDGQRIPVEMSYALDPPAGAGPAATYAYSFHLGTYDPSLPLILDPTVLVYAGYIGGAGDDVAFGIAVDSVGNAYVAGYTTSSETTFPLTTGPDLTYKGNGDAFIAKVNAAGTALVYAGYIGGVGEDVATSIAVDNSGNAYVTGFTNSNETSFPVRVGPELTFSGFPFDAFVAKVNAAGTSLVYAGYIGGSGANYAYGIAVDQDGNAYVTGATGSDQTTFPVKIGPSVTYGGGLSDAFVAKVNSAGTALVYAGYIGGAGTDGGNAIAVDKEGNAYVAGYTDSTQASFPVKAGPSLTYGGGGDAFVAKVNAAGTALDYAGYIGGSNYDYGGGIAVDPDGNAYVTGETRSDQSTFPVIIGPYLTYNGGNGDAFVAKVSAAGAALLYAGYIGGSGADSGNGIAVDQYGNAYVAGETNSDQTTFPVSTGPGLTYNGGADDAFVAKVVSFVPSAFIHLPLLYR